MCIVNRLLEALPASSSSREEGELKGGEERRRCQIVDSKFQRSIGLDLVARRATGEKIEKETRSHMTTNDMCAWIGRSEGNSRPT